MDTEIDSYKLHMLSTRGIYIEPLWIKESRERLRQIKANYDEEIASINRGEIPTKYGFEVWNLMRKDQIKRVRKFTRIKKLLIILKKLKIWH